MHGDECSSPPAPVLCTRPPSTLHKKPLCPTPVGPGTQTRDGRIVGYYAPDQRSTTSGSLGASGRDEAKGRRLELRPYDRSRCAEHGRMGCARPTGGSHGLITEGPAQRFEGARRTAAPGKIGIGIEQRGQRQYKGRSPVGPRPGRLGCYSSSTKVTSRLTL